REHLDGYAAAHDLVLAEEDVAHAAGAERSQNFVFTAEDEVPPSALEQLIGLEAGQELSADQGVGQRRGCFRQGAGGAAAFEMCLEPLRIDQATLVNQFLELVRC